MIEKIIVEDIKEERLLIKNDFNHYFVIDVKPTIFQNENWLYHPSTITQFVNEEELINKR